RFLCMPADISIELLADHTDLIARVGEIRWEEWGHPPEPEDLDWWVTVTANESGRDHLPVTWVAIDQGQAVGAVGLAVFDLEERRDRTPWIIGMVVSPEYRGMGIGSQLLARLQAFALRQDYSEIWVATGGHAVDFYRKNGWEQTEILRRSTTETATILV